MADTVDMHRSKTNSIRKLEVREDRASKIEPKFCKNELYKKNVKFKKNNQIQVQVIFPNLLSRFILTT